MEAVYSPKRPANIKPFMILAKIEGLRAEKAYCETIMNMQKENETSQSKLVLAAMQSRANAIDNEIEKLLFG